LMGVDVNSGYVDKANLEYGERRGQFFYGEVLDLDLSLLSSRADVVYWNDVMEHLPPDEIPDVMAAVFKLLRPGGALVTITPNWHIRPSDITRDFKPPRSEPEGFHLKEYSLREVASILNEAGFEHVQTPIFATRTRCYLMGSGLMKIKSLFEPALEWLPFRVAQIIDSVMGLSVTIAVKQ